MTVWVALLRGINVGGNNILPMKDLRNILGDLGYHDPKTYIHSGNCVFTSSSKSASEISASIASEIKARFQFKPRILLLTLKQFTDAIEANPYKDFKEEKEVQLYFLTEPPTGKTASLFDDLKKANEACTLTENVFYLHAPDGIGRSKLAEKVEKILDVACTCRNLRSARKIAALTQQ